jgi:hypothetical protein
LSVSVAVLEGKEVWFDSIELARQTSRRHINRIRDRIRDRDKDRGRDGNREDRTQTRTEAETEKERTARRQDCPKGGDDQSVPSTRDGEREGTQLPLASTQLVPLDWARGW